MGRVRVVFEVSCPTIGFEEVRVVGSPTELGAWDPALSVPLRTSDQHYPLWRSPEVLLPREAQEAAQYKYVMVFSGSVVQWEAGPNRVLQPGSLLEGSPNLIEDVMYDLDDSIARRNSGVRIRFQESLEKGQLSGLDTSRFASSVPSPLRTCSAGQTPVETRGGSTRDLEAVLKELVRLEPLHTPGRADVRRAAAAVRAAIEAERNSGRSRLRSRASGCAVLSLMMVPLLPVLLGGVILWRVPSARGVSLRRAWPWAAQWAVEAAADKKQGSALAARRRR
eukprot:CAMPEP_0183434624 /NCGR_PEP_ID=MMETSP0370-20130417/64097_1 /TAXON_ID=268820 /ORGANISM="Peridinium aciculiferum, Strain PAER-2" /LENGTH=279 /DNA_ID=CAMNT_0025621365 /DNA_START=120 /DNA_END=959 /DNA_ORIENTATION=-